MLESRHFLVTHAGKHLKHQSHEQLEEVGQVCREVFESFLYLLSGITFAAGSILFLPGVYEHDERNDLTSGHTPSPTPSPLAPARALAPAPALASARAPALAPALASARAPALAPALAPAPALSP